MANASKRVSDASTTVIDLHLLGPKTGTPLLGAQDLFWNSSFSSRLAIREPIHDAYNIFQKELKCLYVFGSGKSTLNSSGTLYKMSSCGGVTLGEAIDAINRIGPNSNISWPCILGDRLLRYGKEDFNTKVFLGKKIREEVGDLGMAWLASNAAILLTHAGTHFTDQIIDRRAAKGLPSFVLHCERQDSGEISIVAKDESSCKSTVHRRGGCITNVNHRQSESYESTFKRCFLHKYSYKNKFVDGHVFIE